MTHPFGIAPDASLAEVEAFLTAMKPADRAKVDKIIEPIYSRPWVPQPGPQITAYHHEADELLYGGAAGGGKSDLLLGLSITEHKRSLLFRRQATDLEGLWERVVEMLGGVDAIPDKNSVKKRLTTKDGRMLEMGHLEQPGAEKTWQGRAHDLIGFDEAAQLDEAKVMFVLQWLRSVDPEQRCRAVFATNPPLPEMKGGEIIDMAAGDWLLRWFAPWIDPHYHDRAEPGELRWCVMERQGDRFITHWVDGPGWYSVETRELWSEDEPDVTTVARHGLAKAKSRTFIKSLVQDNAYLIDSGYVERLSSSPEPLRTMLLSGAFGLKLEDHAWQVIPTNWVLAAQRRWEERMEKVRNTPGTGLAPMLVLAADIAQGGVDTTVLAPLHSDNMIGELTTRPGRDTPDGPSVVGLLTSVQRNGALIVLDGSGGWGISTRDMLRKHHSVEAMMCNSAAASRNWSNDMLYKFLNTRAEMWWKFREALDPDSGFDIALPPSDILRSQLTSVHYTIDKNVIQIESKDALRKRLGSSTDEADAVLMAWHYRKIAHLQRHRPDPIAVEHGGWNHTEKEREEMRSGGHQVAEIDPLADWDI